MRWARCRLVHKQYRDYDEAVKCYKNALRMDKESQQVLRDLAGLQVCSRHAVATSGLCKHWAAVRCYSRADAMSGQHTLVISGMVR